LSSIPEITWLNGNRGFETGRVSFPEVRSSDQLPPPARQCLRSQLFSSKRNTTMKAAVIQRANSPLFLKNAPSRSPNPEKSLSASTPAGFATAILSLCWDSLLLRIPIIPGHEVAGVVEKVGPNVAWPKAGDRFGTTWLFSSCGHCIQCAQDMRSCAGRCR